MHYGVGSLLKLCGRMFEDVLTVGKEQLYGVAQSSRYEGVFDGN